MKFDISRRWRCGGHSFTCVRDVPDGWMLFWNSVKWSKLNDGEDEDEQQASASKTMGIFQPFKLTLSHLSFPARHKQVDLYIDRLPRLPKEHNYKCIFDKKEQTTATSMSFGLSCPLPKVMHRPKIQPGRGELSHLSGRNLPLKSAVCDRPGMMDLSRLLRRTFDKLTFTSLPHNNNNNNRPCDCRPGSEIQ